MLSVRKRAGAFHVCELHPNGGGYGLETVQAFETEEAARDFLLLHQPDEPRVPVADLRQPTPKIKKRGKRK